ncbi:NAD(P)/FAD-dependent oxidoreductase [Sphaerochaeta globosa]|uniref:FAD dependent oxidoreductase n=1 Tax=Sphaerochaeta globosa (strain ATCC BAA-1886 / DSM 22777 / Buddy) TaxID=158189 RepID=F0RVE6_SPHGB|nr:FAD-binding oxidoreductase [Sphaerochaeta globosa]ADY12938.1 FAD dependent oxidoreductase [Sphaerochaeta globosa str. Buddy]
MTYAADVLVIGGGIIGLSCGFYLSKRGKRVFVLDSGGFADGASGACDDMILFQSKKPGINLALTFESLELYKSLLTELDDDLGFANMGGMVLIENQQELEIMEEFVAQQRSYGLDVEVIDKRAMLKKQPFLSDHIIASTYSKMDSQVDPFSVMRGFERKGGSYGMKVFRRNGVVGIDRIGTGDYQVVTEDGSIYQAPIVVNAAGTWAGQIGEMVGATIPIKPKRGQIIVTERIPQIGDTNLWSAKYLVTKLRSDVVVDLNEDERSMGLSMAITRSSGDTYLIGSTREFVGFDKNTTIAGIRAIIKQTLTYLPKLRDVNFIRAMAGLRPSTPDGRMLLGEHAGIEGFFTAAGHEGDGIALAPITGKLLASMVCRDPVDHRLDELSPNRFANP